MRPLRFLAIVLTALSLGATFSHVLQMPAKLAYSGAQWVLLQQTLYGNFRGLGLLIEIGAVACALTLALAVRGRHPSLGWTAFGATCLAGAHAAWWVGALPVNAQLALYTPQALPVDLAELRLRWEYTHALRFVLQGAALGALVASVLVETPRRG
jgi:hypothetical protein